MIRVTNINFQSYVDYLPDAVLGYIKPVTCAQPPFILSSYKLVLLKANVHHKEKKEAEKNSN